MQARRKAKLAKSGDSINLNELIASGEAGAYEALQLYRSRSLRAYGKGEKMLALKIVVDGTINLVRGRYYAAATEICNQMIEFLNEMQLDIISPEIREIVFSVDDALIDAVGGNSIEEDDDLNSKAKVEDANALKMRHDFLKNAIKWTQVHGRRDLGDAALHVRLASSLWSKNQEQAIFHYAAGEAPTPMAQSISVTYGNKDVFAKRDQALVSAIVHFLSLENLRDANECMNQFKKAQKNRGNNADSKLLTFASQLLELCRRDAQPLFKQLYHQLHLS